MNNDLYTKTLELAKTTKLSPKEICASLNVTERWFYKLISGEIKNPGVLNVQSLFNLLNENPADEGSAEKRCISDRRESRRCKVLKA